MCALYTYPYLRVIRISFSPKVFFGTTGVAAVAVGSFFFGLLCCDGPQLFRISRVILFLEGKVYGVHVYLSIRDDRSLFSVDGDYFQL